MLRRQVTAVLFALALLPVLPVAADEVDDLVGVLRGQGFEVEVERTLLGRTRIVARSDGGRREIIVNGRTGEVLRDVWTDKRGRSGPSELADHRSDGDDDHGGGGGDDHGSGSGKGGGDDD